MCGQSTGAPIISTPETVRPLWASHPLTKGTLKVRLKSDHVKIRWSFRHLRHSSTRWITSMRIDLLHSMQRSCLSADFPKPCHQCLFPRCLGLVGNLVYMPSCCLLLWYHPSLQTCLVLLEPSPTGHLPELYEFDYWYRRGEHSYRYRDINLANTRWVASSPNLKSAEDRRFKNIPPSQFVS